MADLVDNKKDVVRNILTFTGSHVSQRDRQRTLKNRMHFIACKKGGQYIFAPIDFAFLNNHPNLFRAIDIPHENITRLLGDPYNEEVPGYKEIYDSYTAYCVSHQTRPNAVQKTRHFWVIDSDILHSQSSAHNADHSTGNDDSLLQDIEDIKRDRTISKTTRKALIEARIGQGRFRDEVMTQWGYACAFTGCKTPEALRASHIKPWKDCSNDERLDRANGLILVANLDALFDRYLISFEDSGQMRVSAQLSKEEQKLLGVRAGCLRKELNEKQCSYLAHHHENFNRREKAGKGV